MACILSPLDKIVSMLVRLAIYEKKKRTLVCVVQFMQCECIYLMAIAITSQRVLETLLVLNC